MLTCRRVFVAPSDSIDLRSTAQDLGDPLTNAVLLAPREVSLLQSWAAQARLPWTPIQRWLADGQLIGTSPDQAHAAPTAAGPAASGAATSALPGVDPLRAERANDLQDVLRKLGLSSSHVITWPDPVDRSNQTMQKTFQLADDLIKAANGAIRGSPRS